MKIVMVKWFDRKPVDPDWQLIPEERCMCHVLPFDEEKAHKMSSFQVRKVYPRFNGKCASCGYDGISYSSFAHYVYGDW